MLVMSLDRVNLLIWRFGSSKWKRDSFNTNPGEDALLLLLGNGTGHVQQRRLRISDL